MPTAALRRAIQTDFGTASEFGIAVEKQETKGGGGGAPAPPAAPSSAVLTMPFVQPDVGQAAPALVSSTASFSIGQTVTVADLGQLFVVDIPAPGTLTLQNTGAPGNGALGATTPAGALVTAIPPSDGDYLVTGDDPTAIPIGNEIRTATIIAPLSGIVSGSIYFAPVYGSILILQAPSIFDPVTLNLQKLQIEGDLLAGTIPPHTLFRRTSFGANDFPTVMRAAQPVIIYKKVFALTPGVTYVEHVPGLREDSSPHVTYLASGFAPANAGFLATDVGGLGVDRTLRITSSNPADGNSVNVMIVQ